jgi:hypothetical protein
MVGGRGGPLADMPTTIQRPVPVDEYPDPYGAPPPRSAQPGYGGGYGGNDYGAGNYGGSSYGGGSGYDDRRGGDYGGGAGGGGGGAPYGGIYGQPEEPTRGYDSGYDSPAPRSGGGYGSGNYGSGGYDSPAPRSGGGYDSPAPRSGGGGYGGSGSYDSGYQQPRGGGGYDDRRGGDYGGSRGGGYESDDYDRGYDKGQPRRGNPPPESRGRLDWLDD